MTVKVVDPVEITDTNFTFSGISEPDTSQGEVEFQDATTRYVRQQITLPSGYGYTKYGAYYNENHPTKRYYVPVRNTSTTSTWGIASYDSSFAYVGIKTLSSLLTGDVRVIGFNYIASTGYFVVITRQIASPYNHYYQIYTDITSTITTGTTPTSKQISSMPSAFLTDNVSTSMVRLSDGSFVALLIDSTNDTATLYKLASTGASGASLSLEFGFDYALTQNEDTVYLATVNSESQLVTLSELNSSLGTVSTISTESVISNTLSGVGFSNERIVTVDYDGSVTGYAYLVPMYSDGVNIGAYSIGDQVISTTTHRKYQALARTFVDPEVGATGDDDATWLDIGPTNKWAMFDDEIGTQTDISGTQVSVEITTSRVIDTVAIIGSDNIGACLIRVWRDSDDVLLYASGEISPQDVDAMIGVFEDANDDIFYTPTFYVDNIPTQDEDVRIGVRFTSTAGCSVGSVVIGKSIEIGTAIAGTENDKLDYSTIDYDTYGNLTYTERPIVNYSTYNILSEKSLSGAISRYIDYIRTKDVLWIGKVGDSQEVITYGRIETNPIVYDMPEKINYTVTVRGAV